MEPYSLSAMSALTSVDCPPIQISKLQFDGKTIHVVREDLLPGGTKQRACLPYLEEEMRKGHTTFAYASPFAGFAQVALSYCAQMLGAEVHLFCEKKPDSHTAEFHEFSRLASSYGANIHLCENLQEAEEKAQALTMEQPHIQKIPLGFDCESFRFHLRAALQEQWKNLKLQVHQPPPQLWVSVGSGTLTKTLREVIPHEVQIRGVNVRVLENTDPRLISLTQLPNTKTCSAPESFKERAADAPDQFASNIHYDAKVWQFIQKFGRNGDVWWNVAR